MNKSTAARLLKVAVALSGPNGKTIREVSDELEVSTKTVARDIEFARDRLGLIIVHGVTHSPWQQRGYGHRYRVINTAEALPMLVTIKRLVI